MNEPAANAFSAQWFDGVTPRARGASIVIDRRSLMVRAEDRMFDYPIDGLLLSAPVAGVPLRLSLPDGGTLVFRDREDRIAGLLRRPQRSFACRLEQNPVVVLIALAAVALFAFFAYRNGVPWLAAKVAQRVPVAAEADLGAAVLTTLDQFAFEESDLPDEERTALQAAFARLVAAAEFPERLDLQFRLARGMMGANALALPGGTIVITDQLIQVVDSIDGVAAVLAHEIGHQARRHAMERLLEGSASALIFGAILGEVSGVGSVAAAAPGVFLRLEYSRAAEDQADKYAYQLLKKAGSSPARLADALEAIAGAACGQEHRGDDAPDGKECRRVTGRKSEMPAYLATHPDTQSRILSARSAAGM